MCSGSLGVLYQVEIGCNESSQRSSLGPVVPYEPEHYLAQYARDIVIKQASVFQSLEYTTE